MSNSEKPLADLLIELRRILEEERWVLLSGAPQRLADVVGRKLCLAEAIEGACTRPQAAPCRQALMRLAAYNRGNSIICSALQRQLVRMIDALRNREAHRSYGPDGAEAASPAAQNPLGAA